MFSFAILQLPRHFQRAESLAASLHSHPAVSREQIWLSATPGEKANWKDKGTLFQRYTRASATSFILESWKLFGNFDVLWGDRPSRNGPGLAWGLFCFTPKGHTEVCTPHLATSRLCFLPIPGVSSCGLSAMLGANKCNVQMLKDTEVTPRLCW